METKIQAIHFDASESLVSFIQKKSKNLYVKRKYNRRCSNAESSEARNCNEQRSGLVLTIPTHDDIVATKVADTFEEAIDLAIAALEPQLEKLKDKK